MSAKALSYADYVFAPKVVFTQSRYGVTEIRRGTRDEAAIEARNQSEIASERPRIARSAVCCKLETGGNAKGNPQKCKGEIPGIAKGH